MTQTFKPLELQRLKRRMNFHQPIESDEAKITMQSSAYSVMTDLARAKAVTIGPHESLFNANRRMISKGVRMLLVVDKDQQVMGLITATDVMGEKALRLGNKKGAHYHELQVDDIMTNYDELEVLCWRDVENARVGDIAETLKRAGRQHAIVVDGEKDAQIIRGIFSGSQLARATGEAVDTSAKTANFAALEYALVHGTA